MIKINGKQPWDDISQKATKKPVQVEAIQFDGTFERGDIIYQWARSYKADIDLIELAIDGEDHSEVYVLKIKTLEGWVTARPGSYVVRGSENEFWPIKASVFESTYEVEHPTIKRDFSKGPSTIPGVNPPLVAPYTTPAPGPYPGYPGNGWYVTSSADTVEKKFTGTSDEDAEQAKARADEIRMRVQAADDTEFTIKSARQVRSRDFTPERTPEEGLE